MTILGNFAVEHDERGTFERRARSSLLARQRGGALRLPINAPQARALALAIAAAIACGAGCSSSAEPMTAPNPSTTGGPMMANSSTGSVAPSVGGGAMPTTMPNPPPAMPTTGAGGAPAVPTVPVATATPAPSAAGAAGAGAAAAPPVDYTVEGPLEGECPDGFTPRSGQNTGFMTKHGDARDFIAYLPSSDMDTPRPTFVAFTGTVEGEDQFANQDAALSTTLTGMGWIVLSPVRHCSMSGMSCYAEGSDGWIWYPWNDGSYDDKWAHEIGPDGEFVEEMTRCAAKQWKVDRRRIYLGGISAGGSFSFRNLTYNSDFFAGGVPGSGMWYPKTDSGPLVPSGAQQLMEADPEAIVEGGCCPRPIAENKLEPMIVIDLWGGPSDQWTNPMNNPNRALTFDYRPETQASSNYFASQKDNVVYLACSGVHGHNWPGSPGAVGQGPNAREFNTWMAGVLLSHPKGAPISEFQMPTSFPPQITCVQGRFTDHYPK